MLWCDIQLIEIWLQKNFYPWQNSVFTVSYRDPTESFIADSMPNVKQDSLHRSAFLLITVCKRKKKNTWWCPINYVFHVCMCNKYRKWLPETHWTEKIILFTCAMHSRSACEHLTCQKKPWMDQINGRVVPMIIIGFSQLVFHHSET